MGSLRSVGRSDPPTVTRESEIENAGRLEAVYMSARSIDAIDRPTESPYFRRTSSPTRAPIVLGYHSLLRSGLVQSRLRPAVVHAGLVYVCLHFSFFLSHFSPFIPPRSGRTDSIFAAGLRRKFY